jgi:hypothetical protein
MTKPSINLAEELARLSAATIFELRGEWRRLHRVPPPMRLSRDLLMRGITYKLQERSLGGLSKLILRKMEGIKVESKVSGTQMPALPISLKAGTRLVREWRGVTIACLSTPMASNGTAGAIAPLSRHHSRSSCGLATHRPDAHPALAAEQRPAA